MAPAEVVPPKQASVPADKHEVAFGRVREMRSEYLAQEGRDSQSPSAALGLGFLDVYRGRFPLTSSNVPDDHHLAAKNVQVLPLQSDKLTPATAEVDGGIDQRLEHGVEGGGGSLDLTWLEIEVLMAFGAWQSDLPARRFRDCWTAASSSAGRTVSSVVGRKSISSRGCGKLRHALTALARRR